MSLVKRQLDVITMNLGNTSSNGPKTKRKKTISPDIYEIVTIDNDDDDDDDDNCNDGINNCDYDTVVVVVDDDDTKITNVNKIKPVKKVSPDIVPRIINITGTPTTTTTITATTTNSKNVSDKNKSPTRIIGPKVVLKDTISSRLLSRFKNGVTDGGSKGEEMLEKRARLWKCKLLSYLFNETESIEWVQVSDEGNSKHYNNGGTLDSEEDYYQDYFSDCDEMDRRGVVMEKQITKYLKTPAQNYCKRVIRAGIQTDTELKGITKLCIRKFPPIITTGNSVDSVNVDKKTHSGTSQGSTFHRHIYHNLICGKETLLEQYRKTLLSYKHDKNNMGTSTITNVGMELVGDDICSGMTITREEMQMLNARLVTLRKATKDVSNKPKTIRPTCNCNEKFNMSRIVKLKEGSKIFTWVQATKQTLDNLGLVPICGELLVSYGNYATEIDLIAERRTGNDEIGRPVNISFKTGYSPSIASEHHLHYTFDKSSNSTSPQSNRGNSYSNLTGVYAKQPLIKGSRTNYSDPNVYDKKLKNLADANDRQIHLQHRMQQLCENFLLEKQLGIKIMDNYILYLGTTADASLCKVVFHKTTKTIGDIDIENDISWNYSH